MRRTKLEKMPYKIQKMEGRKKIMVQDLNSSLSCPLCGGYFVDATTLVYCVHVFCRACIIKYFENFKRECPTCKVAYKKKVECFRPDLMIQALVYKIVPGLYSKEMQTREDFYRSTAIRSNSGCSEDSVLEQERENMKEEEDWIASCVGDRTQFFSPEDLISLSLEYYKSHLDTTHSNKMPIRLKLKDTTSQKENTSEQLNQNKDSTSACDKSANSEGKMPNSGNGDKSSAEQSTINISDNKDSDSVAADGKRYLQCPAAVTMQLLMKFLRMKYGLTNDHRVDIIYQGEVLPLHFSLMDIAYTFRWKRNKPMRLFYRIFTPMKIQPIKIINTSVTGGKQLQIVPVKQNSDKSTKREEHHQRSTDLIEDIEEQKHKERLMAHLQLQSKHKLKTEAKPTEKAVHKSPEKEQCVYEYQEPDKEEIRRFAEKRDREWMSQKHLEERNKDDHHVSKKRKKNKHSKNESVHKKRKLHFTSTKKEDLKIKVKLTPHNGHKHKHHKSSYSASYVDDQERTENPTNGQELSAKEKLLQMRQVRHKPISSQALPTKPSMADAISEKIKQTKDKQVSSNPSTEKTVRFVDKPDKWRNMGTNTPPVTKKVDDKQAHATFIETFQSYTEQRAKEKTIQQKVAKTPLESKIEALSNQKPNKPQVDLQKEVKKPEKQPTNLLSNHYSGLTVSKVESGAKRKAETSPCAPDSKKPSLEITPIYPTSSPKNLTPVSASSPNTQKPSEKTQRRPPPATIPLDRIRKSITSPKSSLIISRSPTHSKNNNNTYVGDTSGVLDLSNKSPEASPKAPEPMSQVQKRLTNGQTNGSLNKQKMMSPIKGTTIERSPQLSNLQMLSKVATEHPNLNNKMAPSVRPKVPDLQTLKIPSVNLTSMNLNKTQTSNNNIAKLPKLTEISKMQYIRFANPQIRNVRPNQNQNIRNIPNPSLLVRNQNQNRLNSINSVNATSNTNSDNKESNAMLVEKVTSSVVEKKEITA